MKKCISAVIAFAMLLSLSCPVFAERMLKPIGEAAPPEETVTIPEEEVPQAALPLTPLSISEYELNYIEAATTLGEEMNKTAASLDRSTNKAASAAGQALLSAMREQIAKLADVTPPEEYGETGALFNTAKARVNEYYDSFTAMSRTPGTAAYTKAARAGEAARSAILAAINSFVETYTELHPDARFSTIQINV